MSDKPWQKIDANSSGYTIDLEKNDDTVVNPKLIVGTATTGMVRVEWIQARYGLVFPTNWGWVQLWQYTGVQGLYPLGYQVDDAQNLIVMKAMEQDYDWVLLYEHDMLPQPDAMLRFAEYMKTELVPVVSGFYFTRSMPSEPLIYRGRGRWPMKIST
ncbi:hypothetical protein [Kaarinaea lacus]